MDDLAREFGKYYKGIKDPTAYVGQERGGSEWIPVGEELPQPQQRLVYLLPYVPDPPGLVIGRGWPDMTAEKYLGVGITHWHPLAPLPTPDPAETEPRNADSPNLHPSPDVAMPEEYREE